MSKGCEKLIIELYFGALTKYIVTTQNKMAQMAQTSLTHLIRKVCKFNVLSSALI